ncbi:MAG: hypothetical protein HGA65_11665 [Oscillochloris sp.]|nr:hypothetical protein [Oscillochloris sp.]
MNRRLLWVLIILLASAAISSEPGATSGRVRPAQAAEPRPTIPPPPTAGLPRPTLPPDAPERQGEPAALCLRLNADPNRTVAPGSHVNYQLTLENRGRGSARHATVTLTFDSAAQTLLDASFSSPTAWVSAIQPGEATIRADRLGPGEHMQATVLMQVRPAWPSGQPVITSAAVRWGDGNAGGAAGANRIALSVARQSASIDTTSLAITPSVGDSKTVFTISYDGFAPEEQVARWYYDRTGKTTALDLMQADSTGAVAFMLPASGFAPGEVHLVAQGLCSQVLATGTVHVVEAPALPSGR